MGDEGEKLEFILKKTSSSRKKNYYDLDTTIKYTWIEIDMNMYQKHRQLLKGTLY